LHLQARMASIITHSSHPEHQLRKMKLKYPFTCNLCNQPGAISCYRCTPCKFSIHESCPGVTAGGAPSGPAQQAGVGTQGTTVAAGAMGGASSGVGVQKTKAESTRAKLFGAGAFGGAGIMGTVATIVVTGAGKSLVGKAMDSVLGRKKETTEEGSTEAGGSALDETPDEMNGGEDDYEGNGYDEQGDEDEGIDEDEPEEGYGEEQQQDEEEEEEQQQEEGYEGEQQDEEGNEEEQQQEEGYEGEEQQQEEGYEGEEQDVPITSTIEDTETTDGGFFSKVIEIATNGFTGNE
jgi:hypothetical protein